MSTCPLLDGIGAGHGMADALRILDCQAGEMTAVAFGRLFGTHGQLLPVLTAAMTLYVAFFAMGLLTGRTRVGVATLTPRMMTLGVVLTFATSWAAYQNVIWTLISGGPDEVASLIAGTHGSATAAFADRLDALFGAIGQAAHQASLPSPPTETGITPATSTVGGFSASTVLWLSGLMLLLGTAGVLVTSKIALAVLLALGPLFMIFSLFSGTRGLFNGWLKSLVLFALVPLFAVLVGSGALAALAPMVRAIINAGGQPDPREVGIVFVGAFVFLALLIMALKTAGTIIGGWDALGAGGARTANENNAPVPTSPTRDTTATLSASSAAPRTMDERVRQMLAALPPSAPPQISVGGPRDSSFLRTREIAGALPRVDAAQLVSSPQPVDQRLQAVRQRLSAPRRALPKGYLS